MGICSEISNAKHRSDISQLLSLGFCRFQLREPRHSKRCQECFDPQTSQAKTFADFARLFACCASQCHLASDHLKTTQLADPATGSTCMPNLHMFNGSNRLPHVRSIRFWSQGVANSHSFKRKKKQVVTHFFTLQKVRPQIVHGQPGQL